MCVTVCVSVCAFVCVYLSPSLLLLLIFRLYPCWSLSSGQILVEEEKVEVTD